MKQKIFFLVGPTGIGKSRIAINLALKLDAEIISLDSMQVYKGMDIITSKPSLATRKEIKHHLIDFVSLKDEYNVAAYAKDALRKIREILKRKRIPLFVGGTGLYMSILLDGIFKSKAQNKTLRRRLFEEAARFGNEYLYKRLQKVDAEAASRIHPNDTKRLIRALEVFMVCGRPISELQKERKGLSDRYDVKIICLNMERDKLYKRIDVRVEEMFKKGLVSEVKKLLTIRLSKTASCAIGIKELKECFAGSYSLDEAKRLMQKNTRNFAKRQLTWFRKDKRVEWVQVGEEEEPAKVAKKIFEKLN